MELASASKGADFVQQFEAAWASGRPDSFAVLFTDDVVLRQPMMPAVKGRAAARESFERLLRLIPDLHAVVHRWSADGDVVFIEFTLVGTFGGRELSWPAVDRFVLPDGLIAERVSYFDAVPLAIAMLSRPRGWRRLISTGFRPSLGG